MQLIAYIRVSSTGQLDAFGPDSQLADINKWIEANGHEIVSIKTDDISGTVPMDERPRLIEALDMLSEPAPPDGLIVANLGRLARELHIQEAILATVWNGERRVFAADQGEILRDDPDDPMRTAMRQMQGVFMQLDRSMTTKRLRDGRRIKAAAGRHAVGQYKYGQAGVGEGRERDAGPREDELTVVERIHGLRRSGASYRAIAAQLDAEGIKPRKAATWSAMTVRNISVRADAVAE